MLESIYIMSSLNQLKPLSYSTNKDGEILLADIKIKDLVKKYGSPLYLMCEKTIRARIGAYRDSLKNNYPESLVLYASKALNCQAICALVKQEKIGLDVVSLGELYTALSVGFPIENLYFHGNNKSHEELKLCVDKGVNIVVDNFHDINLLSKICNEQKASVLLRVTPGIECHTHEYIKTGKQDSKFGFNLDELFTAIEELQKINVNIKGLHGHIGSQIFETLPHQDTCRVFMDLYKKIKDKFSLEFPDLNLGGGLGIKYMESDDPPEIETWIKILTDSVKALAKEFDLKLPRILVEPGRSIVGPAGITVYEVGNIKNIEGIRKYVCVDGGMADNPRHIMYQAQYQAEIDGKVNLQDRETVTIAGKYCESGDILIRDINLAKTSPGDLLVVFSTGAYNYSMSSNYNRSAKPALVLVADGQDYLAIKRESLEDLLRNDLLPEHLNRGVLSKT
jgi:diaminopimelate decarboxylase